MDVVRSILTSRLMLIFGLCLIVTGTIATIGCRTAPVTNRRQLLVMSEEKENAMGLTAYQQVLKDEPVTRNQAAIDLVRRVGERIAAVADRPDFEWEFNVIDSPTQNAFCLPGGKVAVYTGILPVCETEAGLAVVMAHEIGHAIARHGGERMSQSMAVDGAKVLAEKLAGKYYPNKQEILMKAYGVGSKYGVLLPYSRKQESEADHIGVVLAAKAGYDPTVAPSFWRRFGALKENGQTPEFMSTHPSDERRAADLEGWLAEANSFYQTSQTKHGRGDSIAA